jgi:hypothetical protein
MNLSVRIIQVYVGPQCATVEIMLCNSKFNVNGNLNAEICQIVWIRTKPKMRHSSSQSTSQNCNQAARKLTFAITGMRVCKVLYKWSTTDMVGHSNARKLAGRSRQLLMLGITAIKEN